MCGPLLASAVMDRFGPSAFFIYTAVLHLAFVAVVGVRLVSREGVPANRRGRFVWLLRTSPVIFRLAGASRADRGRNAARNDRRAGEKD